MPNESGEGPSSAKPGYIPSYCPAPGGGQDYRSVTIKEHAEWLQAMSDAAAHAAAEMWGNTAATLNAARDNLLSYGSDLRQDWKSSAAELFMEQVSNSAQSLQAWAHAASANEARLHTLGDAIQTAQLEMRTLYDSYSAEAEDINKNEPGPTWGGVLDKGGAELKEMVQQKTSESMRIMATLADCFVHTTIQDAPQFAGPTSATRAAAGAPAGGGGGAPGGAPGAPGGGAPGMPVAPRMVDTVMPNGPGMALWQSQKIPGGGGIAPPPPLAGAPARPPSLARNQLAPPPNMGSLDAPGTAHGRSTIAPPAIGAAMPSAGLGGARGAIAPPPAIGGAGPGGGAAARGSVPAPPPGMGRSSLSSGMTNLAGRNAPAAPGMPLGGGGGGGGGGRGGGAPPQIPGRSRLSSGSPSMPAGGPGGGPPGRGSPATPALPGRTAPRPAGAQPGAMPPTAGGARAPQGTGANVRAGRPLNGRGSMRPGSTTATGMPGLRGRGGPTRLGRSESAQTTRAALRRGLDGRGVSSGKSGPATGPAIGSTARPAAPSRAMPTASKQVESAPQIVGDEELFAVDQAAPAVIERKQEKVHAKRPGPALGRG